MAKEYVEREAVIAETRKPRLTDAELRRRLALLPAADVRPVVRGKWIKYAPHNSDMMTCSECEKYFLLDGDQYDYHFCPICGALMEDSKE